MTWLDSVWQRWAQLTVARRRARNLRSGAPARAVRPSGLAGVAGLAALVLLIIGGGGVILVFHARHLVALAAPVIEPGAAVAANADQLQAVLPGAAFEVPARGGMTLGTLMGGSLLVMAGAKASAPLQVDLCSQLLAPNRPRLLLLRIGYGFDDVAQAVARSPGPLSMRNVVLAGAELAGMPLVHISGNAVPNFADPGSEALQLSWRGRGPARWVSDASFGQVEQGPQGQVPLRQDGWLVWDERHALHIERHASAACPQAGALLVQTFSAGDGPAAKAMVVAFPSQGRPVAAAMPPGRYRVPATAGATLEDQALFQQLQASKLVRLGADGLIELVPPDLAAWQAGGAPVQAGDLASWGHAALTQADIKLIKRLYRMADGDYVRQQVDVFNSERRLLAWRLRPGVEATVQASVANIPVRQNEAMPAAAARLFAELPQGWAPWSRVAQWPAAAKGAARLSLAVRAGEPIRLMLAGRLLQVRGARVAGAAVDACTGRGCPDAGAVQVVTLEPLAGAQRVELDAAPLDLSALAARGDQQYRHLRVAGGQLVWQAAPTSLAGAVRLPAARDITLADRNGKVLWHAGSPTDAAAKAGLATLLGVRAEHANSVAGMLARLPGATHSARLTLDLPLQAASAAALDCIAMRRGRWDGKACAGGEAVPEGRRAGVVIVDMDNGDVLAAAGAGAGRLDASSWPELRDFDQANPARSPLRLPALQHDGGAHQSPGSTFKVISALGLELAARSDAQLDALLGGMELGAINRLAQQKGFAFHTAAAAYPATGQSARITNYHEQALDRRAQDGRLGLAQALTYSLNTWFAWSGELADRSLFGRAEGGAPDLQPLSPGALDPVRPIVAMAHRLGFEQSMHLDGGLLPADYRWSAWDALAASAAHIDPVHTRHELRQMAIGLRMQVTPLQMALAAGAVGQGTVVAPRLLAELDGRSSALAPAPPVGVRLDRIRDGMKGVVDVGTAASAFRALPASLRRGLYGKTGTAPTGEDQATVWFTGWLEPGSLPGQVHRLALAAYVTHSPASGGEHAAPVVAAILGAIQNLEQRGK